VVSQAILEHGTIRLDAYAAGIVSQMQREPYDMTEHRGHIYHTYPLGTPVFSLPFVWAANRIGRDMSVTDHNYRLQNDLSALLCALIFLVLYRIGRHYVSSTASLAVALISLFGSALISTVGTALAAVDLAVLFVSLSLWIFVRYERGLAKDRDAYLLGFTLFAAFFCRPATATFVLVALIHLGISRRRDGVKVALTALAFLALFILFSVIELRQPLPDYYLSTPLGWLQGRQLGPRLLGAAVTLVLFGWIYLWVAKPGHRAWLVGITLAGLLLALGYNWIRSGHLLPDLQGRRGGLAMGLYGTLLSPSRGLLVFSPFLVLPLLGSLRFWGSLEDRRLAGAVLLFLALHLLGLVSTGAWWGGYAFGPRLLTEVIPGLVLLTVLVWRALRSAAPPSWQRAGAAGYVGLGIVAVLINSYQGMLNPNTLRWNGEMAPAVDRCRECVLDWTYPQFLATSRSLCQRNWDHLFDAIERGSISVRPYRLGDWITYGSGEDGTGDGAARTGRITAGSLPPVNDLAVQLGHAPGDSHISLPIVQRTSKNAVFIGWLRRESGYRWSVCRSSGIAFELGGAMFPDHDLLLELVSGSFGAQEVTVSLNDIRIGEVAFPGPKAPPVTRTIPFDGALLRQNALNQIEIHMPDAASPDPGDDRTLGLAFQALRIRIAD
jgi:hypothetical protein